MKLFIASVGVLVLAAGCASTPPPTAKAASTQAALQQARDEGAARSPEASTYLAKSQDEFARAQSDMHRGKNKDATARLMRSESDANLASALTREAKQKAATDAAEQRVRAMTPTLQPSGR